MTYERKKARRRPEPGSVKIEVRSWERQTGQNGNDPGGYPFSALNPARRLDNKKRGSIEGESFFIPPPLHTANGLVQRARYLHKPITFITRSEIQMIRGKQVLGIRVWKIDPENER